MPLTIEPELPPLRVEDSGAVRVGKTRVLFVLVVQAFKEGTTPEEIVQMYETLDLGETYSVIGYYLRHKPEVEAFLLEHEREAEKVWERVAEYEATRPDILAKKAELKARFAAARANDIGAVTESAAVE